MSYRYTLGRIRGVGPTALWVMLNPSTADDEVDDPTIRKCMGFTKLWGFGSLIVVNLFGARSTKPQGLMMYADPVGPENDAAIRSSRDMAESIIVAWGAHGQDYPERVAAVLALLSGRSLQCLGRTKDGHPRHPLMVAYKTPLEEFVRFVDGEPK